MGDEALTIDKLRSLGGLARARKLTSEERSRIARLAAQARWGKKADAPDPNDPKGTKGDPQPGKPGVGILLSRKACRQAGVSLTQPTLLEIPEVRVA